MTTPLPRHRRDEQWQAHIVQPDGDLEPLALDAEVPGSITWDIDQQSPLGATLPCVGAVPELLTGQTIRLTYSYHGGEHSLPPLVPVKADPVYELGEWFTLDLIDQTILLAADGLDFGKVLSAGTVVTTAMADLIAASAPDLMGGGSFPGGGVYPGDDPVPGSSTPLVALPDLDLTLRNPLELRMSMAPLEAVNQLAETIGCTPLAPRLDGILASASWVEPRLREVIMAFGPGDGAGMLPRVDTTSDYLAAPNVVHYTTGGSAGADPLVGRWIDQDPTSRWSVTVRGRRILATASGDAATQEIANQHAARIGLQARGRGRTATIRGAWQPLAPGDVITTEHPDHPGLTATWEVRSMRISMALGSETVWTLKEVI